MLGVLALVDGWGSTPLVLDVAAEEAQRRGVVLTVAQAPDDLPADARELQRSLLRLAVRDLQRAYPTLVVEAAFGADGVDAVASAAVEQAAVVLGPEHLPTEGVLSADLALLVVAPVEELDAESEDLFADGSHRADEAVEREIADLEALFHAPSALVDA